MDKPTAGLKIQEVDGGVVLGVKVAPGSSKTVITGTLGGMLKIKIAAAPEKGKANQCLVEFLAKQLGVKKNSISIIRGKTSPVKSIKVPGISAERLLNKLGLNKKDSSK